MHKIIVYIELHWGLRRPNLEFYLNGQQLIPVDCNMVETIKFQENVEFHLTAESLAAKDNVFQIIMRDKTDNDTVTVDGESIDHWVKIRELEIDDIKFQMSLYNASKFEHSMPEDWVSNMAQQGYQIEPCYMRAADIRLNGTWTITFDTPIWQWWCENYE